MSFTGIALIVLIVALAALLALLALMVAAGHDTPAPPPVERARVWRWLDRLRPPRLRAHRELEGPERKKLFQGIPDSDPCLRAMVDLLEDKLQGNFLQAIEPSKPDRERLAALDRAADAYMTLETIEVERKL